MQWDPFSTNSVFKKILHIKLETESINVRGISQVNIEI